MSVTDTWRLKRPGPASDRDNVTRQTLRAGIRAPPPEKPMLVMHGGFGSNYAWCSVLIFIIINFSRTNFIIIFPVPALSRGVGCRQSVRRHWCQHCCCVTLDAQFSDAATRHCRMPVPTCRARMCSTTASRQRQCGECCTRAYEVCTCIHVQARGRAQPQASD